jgi:AAA+ ATPase superfamily predicted ATPase
VFVNRTTEIARLARVLGSDTAQMVVIYGRRRCGKSTLLKKVMNDEAVYFSADMREAPFQIEALAQRIGKFVPGFANPVYPGWDSLLRSLNTGEGINETGILKSSGKEVIGIDPRYFRPTEVDILIGNPAKAKKMLGWVPKITFKDLVKIMVKSDFEKAKRRAE